MPVLSETPMLWRHSLLTINLIDAQRRHARPFRLRHSQPLASRRQRVGQAIVLSTTQRLESTANLPMPERLMIVTFTCAQTRFTPSRNLALDSRCRRRV